MANTKRAPAPSAPSTATGTTMADPGATEIASGETTNALEKTQVLCLGIKAYLHPALLQIPGGKIFIKLPGFNFDWCHCRQGNWEIYLLHVEVRVSFGLVSSMEECLLYHQKFCSAYPLDVYSCLRNLIIS